MKVPYLSDRSWSNWTREERFFCAVLFGHARLDPAGFAAWTIERSHLDLSPEGEWDLGYEVCLYRDFLWPTEKTARQQGFPAKRTFDLCLFGETAIIIIEAKVVERFSAKQNKVFVEDAARVARLPGFKPIKVRTVALASSRYFTNADMFARPDALAVFNGVITWSDVAGEFGNDRILHRADVLYKMKKSDLLAGAPV